ncbi:hypothetical protein KAR91_00990, partial [Candidatus Pacearchaeota archaeon]|nr:hypothetical protein [Candidatus Pacearchaeota archaeon]
GFYDGTWIRSIKWNGDDWNDFVPADWKYSMSMQEGALWFSILSDDLSLMPEIESMFNYLYEHINEDGSIIGVPGPYGQTEYEYGLILSCLALGNLYFEKIDRPEIAERCYENMKKIYHHIKDLSIPSSSLRHFGRFWRAGHLNDDYHYFLIGFANAWKVFNKKGENQIADEIKSRIILIANWFVDHQDKNGRYSDAIQANVKTGYALCFSFDVTGDRAYLKSVKDNVDWIIVNRMHDNGGIVWSSYNETEFFECHQVWFALLCRMLMNRNPDVDYTTDMVKAWKFLTDENWANIDWYVHNKVNNDSFFAYRSIHMDGKIQQASFKGSYEIGAAIWSLSANCYSEDLFGCE